ncbi:hypothetical protein [Actinoplanes sp. NPDC049681]|uniref:hypothetical protein n=1 Tax=Actinoplanes sp. NPDC049681 TaxID=3363905 RepID=UPI0037B16276
MRRLFRILAASILLVAALAGPADARARPDHGTRRRGLRRGTGVRGFTIRDVVHTTTGGSGVRIHVSNRFGTRPVLMGHPPAP